MGEGGGCSGGGLVGGGAGGGGGGCCRFIIDELSDPFSSRVVGGLSLMGIPLTRQVRAVLIAGAGAVAAVLVNELRKILPMSTSALFIDPDGDLIRDEASTA
eukprot:COSAG01_NODE_6309_length_3745_cov_1.422655_3_plen_102_part_00